MSIISALEGKRKKKKNEKEILRSKETVLSSVKLC